MAKFIKERAFKLQTWAWDYAKDNVGTHNSRYFAESDQDIAESEFVVMVMRCVSGKYDYFRVQLSMLSKSGEYFVMYQFERKQVLIMSKTKLNYLSANLSAIIYEKLIQNLGNLLFDYYGEDEYEKLIEDMDNTYGTQITNQAEDFATDRFFGVIDDEGNEIE